MPRASHNGAKERILTSIGESLISIPPNSVLAPSAKEISELANCSPSSLYQRGSSYEDKLEAVTGFRVLKNTGIVLVPELETPEIPIELQAKMLDLSQLSPDELGALIGRAVLELSSRVKPTPSITYRLGQ